MTCKHYSTAQTRGHMVHIHKDSQHLTEILGGQKTWEGTVLWDFKSIRRLSPSQTPSRRQRDCCRRNLRFVQSQRYLFATLCSPQPSTQRTFAGTGTP